MAGHSKWANIKHKKAAADAKRGKVFTRLAKEMTVAAKLGGADETTNPRLRAAVLKARTANMPKDNIERAIKKGTGDLDGVSFEEIVYEGYAVGGIAIMVEVMTDKKSRTLPEIKNIFSKNAGSLAEAGAVSYLFEYKGEIVIDAIETSEDDFMNVALEAGAEDFQKVSDSVFVVTTSREDFAPVLSAFSDLTEKKSWEILESGLKYIPQAVLEPDSQTMESAAKLIDALENHDDVQNVFYNVELPEEE
jgi:YebC/PmpR family DNA-binding regulatory protein